MAKHYGKTKNKLNRFFKIDFLCILFLFIFIYYYRLFFFLGFLYAQCRNYGFWVSTGHGLRLSETIYNTEGKICRGWKGILSILLCDLFCGFIFVFVSLVAFCFFGFGFGFVFLVFFFFPYILWLLWFMFVCVGTVVCV